MEHEHSLVIPPHFDGNNYAYWKVRMKAFLKSIDERVWNSVEYGWEKPTTPVSEWQTSQKETAGQSSNNSMSPQCFECQGYGHMKSVCPTYLKFKGKTMAVTFSDDEVSDDESGCDETSLLSLLLL